MFIQDRLQNEGYAGVYCTPSEDYFHPERPFKPLLIGRRLAEKLRGVKTRGLTGDLDFDEKTGVRKKNKKQKKKKKKNTKKRTKTTKTEKKTNLGFDKFV